MKLDITINGALHIHQHGDHEQAGKLDSLIIAGTELNRKLDQIMAAIQDVLDDVEAEKTLIGSVSDLITGLQKQIADALSGATLPPAVQAKVDAVFAAAEANKKALSDALVANTPSA